MEAATGLVSRKAAPLAGRVAVPGDKSISHRALMLGGLAIGETVITGLLEGEDVLATATALGAMGAKLVRDESGIWHVHGVGVGGLGEPSAVLDLGNAGTATRLLMGILATHPFTSFMTGDGSLRARPMGRVIAPLSQIGARFVARSNNRLPLAVIGTENPLPISYTLPVASAQVKSAILLAGLNIPGTTSVIEPQPTRDHTERMVSHFGSAMSVEDGKHGRRISVTGPVELKAAPITVPGDPSSAAFPLVAACLVEGSDVTIAGVGLNPLRAGLMLTLREMGAAIEYQNQRIEGGEPVADLRVRAGPLQGVTVPPERAPSMIDEYLALAVAASCAEGPTVMRGLAELRVKESDRLAAIAENLTACGARVEVSGDDLTVFGSGRPPAGGCTVAAQLDHRIAMAFLVLGAATAAPIAIDDGRPIATSFPGFVTLMNGLGCRIEAVPA